MESMRVFSQPREFLKPVVITLVAAPKCPYCKAAKKELMWLERQLSPYVKIVVRQMGQVRTDLAAGTYDQIVGTSTDIPITQTYDDFGGQAPLTIIGSMENPHGAISGCDKFESRITEKYPIELVRKLPKEDIMMILGEKLDGTWYVEQIFYKHLRELLNLEDEAVMKRIDYKVKRSQEILARLETFSQAIKAKQKQRKKTAFATN